MMLDRNDTEILKNPELEKKDFLFIKDLIIIR